VPATECCQCYLLWYIFTVSKSICSSVYTSSLHQHCK